MEAPVDTGSSGYEDSWRTPRVGKGEPCWRCAVKAKRGGKGSAVSLSVFLRGFFYGFTAFLDILSQAFHSAAAGDAQEGKGENQGEG